MPPPSRRTLPTTVVARLLNKWHPDDSTCSLFLDRHEADDFLRTVADLHRAMLSYASAPQGGGLTEAQELLDTAMRRLQLELHILLDEDQHVLQSIRAVTDAMVAAGYGKECVSTFKARRRAALSSTLHRLLGFSSPKQQQQLHKLTWDQVDAKMQTWITGASVAFKSVFSMERELCDGVFFNSAIGDAVFAAIADDHAVSLIAFAEAAIARACRGQERLFRVLDVHQALTDTILPAIVAVFGEKSDVTSRAVALVTLKVGEAARSMVSSFEAAIQKEPSKTTAPGAAVHPLTRYVMNYLVFLADYYDKDNIFQHELLVSVLLRKLEAKAGSYKEAALSYLFLANNTHYVVKKVGGSAKLAAILGEEWAEGQRAMTRGYVDVYVRAAWGSSMDQEALMEAVTTQQKWVAADDEMGDALRLAVRTVVVPTYRLFYRRHGANVKLTPGDVTAMIGGLFRGRPHKDSSIPVPRTRRQHTDLTRAY